MLPEQCRNGHGQAFQSKWRTNIPGTRLPERQGRGGTPQSTVGAERLLRARHTWVGISRERGLGLVLRKATWSSRGQESPSFPKLISRWGRPPSSPSVALPVPHTVLSPGSAHGALAVGLAEGRMWRRPHSCSRRAGSLPGSQSECTKQHWMEFKRSSAYALSFTRPVTHQSFM